MLKEKRAEANLDKLGQVLQKHLSSHLADVYHANAAMQLAAWPCRLEKPSTHT